MPVWPKSFYVMRADLQIARIAPRLRRKTDAASQPRAFDALTRRLAKTAYWREAGIEAGMSYAAFRTRVAPRSYDDLLPAIERMKRGESDVLWPGRCSFFAATAGTTTGQRRQVPITDDLLFHFRDAGQDALLYYGVRKGHARVFAGRHLFLGGTTALTPIPESAPHHTYAGNLGGVVALHMPPWADKHLYEPGAEIARLTRWKDKLDAIAERTATRNVSLIAGQPNLIGQLAATLLEKNAASPRPAPHLQALWPALECLVHGGIPITPFQTELRALLGPKMKFHEVYPAAEGFIACQDNDAALGLRLMQDRGIFFEFVPMTEFEEPRIGQLGAKAVPLADVKPEVDYALLITTPGGFSRYLLGDVVRFISTVPPRLIVVGRTRLQLNAFGERVSEKDITDALVAVCTRNNWSIVNFHVAPLFPANRVGGARGCHEWWIELHPGTMATPIGPPMAAALDAELQRTSPTYAAKRRALVLDAPTVRLVMPGVFAHWLQHQGRWGEHHKTPRCRSDRALAEELAQVTNFARD
jgi:hypothetical protein